MNAETKAERIEKIINKFSSGRGGLIAILEGIQSRFGYLPKEALEVVAKKTGKSLVDIYGVATFYKSFTLNPRGKHLVSVCLGTACHVLNAPKVVEEFERQLDVKAGNTAKDGEFTLETVNCLGACALGPIVMVDGHYFSHVTPSKVKQIISKTKKGLDKIEVKKDKRVFPVLVSCPKCNRSLMDKENEMDGQPAVRLTVSFNKTHGWLLLSSLYGSHTVEAESEIPNDTVLNFFCPFCHGELLGSAKCPKCDANMIPMTVKGGGTVQICSRKGCKEHLLVLNDADMND